MAALDFRHTTQKTDEPVSDFIGRLEQIFQIGFGREHLSHETRDMLLYGQLQEGLLYTLMESPAVSGAQNYKELCVAAKREERRLAELKRKQQYLKAQNATESGPTKKFPSQGYTEDLIGVTIINRLEANQTMWKLEKQDPYDATFVTAQNILLEIVGKRTPKLQVN